MGKRILVTQGLLDRILHLLVQQRDYGYVFDDVELRSMFVYPHPSDKGLSSAKRLSFYDKVLHLIITHIIQRQGFNYSIVIVSIFLPPLPLMLSEPLLDSFMETTKSRLTSCVDAFEAHSHKMLQCL
ncbi:Uncharacterized protein TCM_013481 [Theobroma cacao]|uniref:Uncharacterized protein n=1 Tax=Theobroma cacao TaxID=3641 RepID=A0A061FVN4_THECC|nr:Uncharacterized protein TCM_013481 [Theobroma cacao]